MKAKELAEELLKHPEFDIDFSFSDDNKDSTWPFNIRRFEKIRIGDIGHSSKVIILDGDEDL